jgi:hypothetical protein
MKKALHIVIICALSILVMSYGMTLESESLLINGVAVLEFVIPALTFMLTQIFILMFDKESNPLIIIGTSLAIGLIANLITIGYFSLSMEDFNGGILGLILLMMIVTALSLIALTLYSKSQSHSYHHPKLKS